MGSAQKFPGKVSSKFEALTMWGMKQCGWVQLREVVEAGCQHYAERFEDFLLDEASMTYIRPPRVMVTDADWDLMCEGLINSGICG